MAGHGAQLSRAGVRIVVFLHGIFLGTDLFGVQRLDEVGGLKRGYSRGIPGMEALLSLMREETNGLGAPEGGMRLPFHDDDPTRQWIDDMAQDACNFSQPYVERFSQAVNRDVPRPITCVRSVWSSEHHHLGRAHAACSLIGTLTALATRLRLEPGDRVLIQAHGHGGQVLALASNLLAPVESSSRATLLGVLKAYHNQTKAPSTVIESIETLTPLLESGKVLNGIVLDIVTFGTPVRYGWDPSGLGKLLHIVNHRMMRPDSKRWLAKTELPQITMEMPLAWGGDYVQQLAVAACDALPQTAEAKEPNKALWEIVEPWDGFERWLECARKSVRCANDGQCLLVDYKDSTGSTNARDHVYGHAAYTRLPNLLFNTSEIVQALYGTAPGIREA